MAKPSYKSYSFFQLLCFFLKYVLLHQDINFSLKGFFYSYHRWIKDVTTHLSLLGDDSTKHTPSVLIALDLNRSTYFPFFNHFTCPHSSKRHGRSHTKRRRCTPGSLVKIFNGRISWSNPAMNRLCYIFWFNIESALLEKTEVHV